MILIPIIVIMELHAILFHLIKNIAFLSVKFFFFIRFWIILLCYEFTINHSFIEIWSKLTQGLKSFLDLCIIKLSFIFFFQSFPLRFKILIFTLILLFLFLIRNLLLSSQILQVFQWFNLRFTSSCARDKLF